MMTLLAMERPMRLMIIGYLMMAAVPALACPQGYYEKSDGHCVEQPTALIYTPQSANPDAMCSFVCCNGERVLRLCSHPHWQDACSNHGGICLRK